MKKPKIYKRQFFMFVLAIISIIIAVFIIFLNNIVSQGIKNGLFICGNIIIPSLFPFIVVSDFLVKSGLLKILSAPIGFIFSHIFKIPKDTSAAVLLSFVGGYPTGALAIGSLYSSGQITKKTAERMLCFCVNAGPAFVIGIVGMTILKSPTAGIIIFISQIISTIIIGVIMGINKKSQIPKNIQITNNKSIITAFVEAVSCGTSAIITICSFIILFSGAFAVLNYYEIPLQVATFLSKYLNLEAQSIQALFTGIFEVTNGVSQAINISVFKATLICAFITAFSGFCIMFQIISISQKNNLNTKLYLITRPINGVLSIIITYILLLLTPSSVQVLSNTITQRTQIFSNNAPASALLLIFTAFFLLSFDKKYTTNTRKSML